MASIRIAGLTKIRDGTEPAQVRCRTRPPRRQREPPPRWVAGADAVDAISAKATTLLAQADAHLELSSSLAHETTT